MNTVLPDWAGQPPVPVPRLLCLPPGRGVGGGREARLPVTTLVSPVSQWPSGGHPRLLAPVENGLEVLREEHGERWSDSRA